MPKNVGRYSQGNIKTQADFGYNHGGEKTPQRADEAGVAPANQLPVRNNGNTVGNNDGHKAH